MARLVMYDDVGSTMLEVSLHETNVVMPGGGDLQVCVLLLSKAMAEIAYQLEPLRPLVDMMEKEGVVVPFPTGTPS